jgi:hypothetical protein
MIFLKILVYLKQFGLSRTLSFIRSHIHMYSHKKIKHSDWRNPNEKDKNDATRNVAIIGAGKFAFSTIAYFLKIKQKNFLRCVYSPGVKSAISLCKYYNGLYVPSDWRDILKDEKVKLVYIASPFETHAKYAIACIEAGKNVYIEKPPVVSESQLRLLLGSMIKNPDSKVFLGFNRSSSKSFNELRKLVADESGCITAQCNMSVNGSPVTNELRKWEPNNSKFINTDSKISSDEYPLVSSMSYTDFKILDHLCHFTDLIVGLIPIDQAFPCVITPKQAPSKDAHLEFSFSIFFADKSHISFNHKEIPNLLEGMDESIELRKGNLIAKLSNFQSLQFELRGKTKNKKSLYRDHGHESSIQKAYVLTCDHQGRGESIEYVEATSKLYLKVAEAMNNMVSTEVNLDRDM